MFITVSECLSREKVWPAIQVRQLFAKCLHEPVHFAHTVTSGYALSKVT